MALQGVDPAWRAGATAYISLHTADPGEAGTAITSEANYTGYARVAITKSSAWTDGGSTFSNAAQIQFGQCSAGSSNCTHFSIVTTASGAGQILYSGILGTAVPVAPPIQPLFNAGALTVTED